MSGTEIDYLVGEKAILEALNRSKPLNLTVKYVDIPEGVEVSVEGKRVRVKGEKGEIVKDFSHIRNVYVFKKGNQVIVAAKTENKNEKKPVATVATKIKKMVEGVQREYIYKHKVVYSHFPIRIRVEGKKIVVENFLGRKDKIIIPIYGESTKVDIVFQHGSEIPDEVIIHGPDLEAVSQTSGAIHDKLRLKGKFKKDPRVFMDGVWRYEIKREGEL
ncbi:MAG: 50S ribosomal protein L6 [Candidatus Njordarchaeia archaeon]